MGKVTAARTAAKKAATGIKSLIKRGADDAVRAYKSPGSQQIRKRAWDEIGDLRFKASQYMHDKNVVNPGKYTVDEIAPKQAIAIRKIMQQTPEINQRRLLQIDNELKNIQSRLQYSNYRKGGGAEYYESLLNKIKEEQNLITTYGRFE